jgi:hypothetical protein
LVFRLRLVNIGMFAKVTMEQLVMVKILSMERLSLWTYHLQKAVLDQEEQGANQVQIVRQTLNQFWHL